MSTEPATVSEFDNASSGRPSGLLGPLALTAGWLAIPVAIILMILAGLSSSTEDKEDFDERQEQQAQDQQQGEGQPQPGQSGQPQSGQAGQPQSGQGQPGDQQQGQQGRPGQGEGESIIISTEDGDVIVQLDENGNPVALVPVEEEEHLEGDFYTPSDTGRVFDLDSDGGQTVGLRVTEDGRLDTVQDGDIANEDFLFKDTTERLALLRPDGSTIALEPSETFDLRGTEIDFDRNESPATELGEVVLERTGIEQSANLKAGAPADHPGLAVNAESGVVRFDLDREGNFVADYPHQSWVDDNTVFDLADLVGLRITNEGRVEAIEVTDLVGSRDYQLTGEDDYLDLVRPDDRRIRLIPSSEDRKLRARRVFIDRRDRNLRTNTTLLVAAGPDLPSNSKLDNDSQPLSFQTEAGLIRIDLDKDGNLVADQPNRDNVTFLDGPERTAIRVDENGNFEVVPVDELQPGDVVLEPDGNGGFDLVRPDGSRVEFRPDGENGGMTATEFDADGNATELTPNEDGSVTLEDGTEIGAIDEAEDSGPIERLIESTKEMPWLWLLVGFALLAFLSIGTAIYLHRNRPDDPFDYSQLVSAGKIPRDRFEEFLSMLQADSDPTRAVRLGFAAAESGLGGVPRKRFTETPFEWHERVKTEVSHQAEPIEVICDLFAKARFAPGDSQERDRSRMIDQLRVLNDQSTDALHPRPITDRVNEPA